MQNFVKSRGQMRNPENVAFDKILEFPSRREEKKELIALARKILSIIYHMVQDKQAYIEGGRPPQPKGD